ncbi:alpha/beta fold hydrolase [Asticcacaulis solisilvae]|uniref:alpha/beta fold hydrolase n=1 Tax=Asticcacaulis solisilvae TaxID=1217274 RepID=UPI003FD8DE0B
MSILERNAVSVRGTGQTPLLFLHGYGCDQQIWQGVLPHFESSHRCILLDHVGSGRSDLSAYDKIRYGTLHAYAEDLIEVCDALGLRGADVLAHSVACMITLLAAKKRPDLFGRLMLLGPSPCYVDDGDYVGGFTHEGIDDLLSMLALNHAAWSAQMAPLVMANPDRPELATELEGFFCRNDPGIIHHFAGVVFRSDHRAEIAGIDVPCLVMQCQDDIVAPLEVGVYLHGALPASELMVLDSHGHYPQLSAPDVVAEAAKCYLARPVARAA